jgi:hypothetical protein
MKLADQYFMMVANKHTAALDSLMAATLPDTTVLHRLTGKCYFIIFLMQNTLKRHCGGHMTFSYPMKIDQCLGYTGYLSHCQIKFSVIW